MKMYGDIKLISGNANPELAQKISKELNVPLCSANIKRFNDQEIMVEILENVRGDDVFVIQPTSSPTNDNLMELLVTIDALKRGSAGRITAVMPYFGYARQDRKTTPRSPISAKLVADLITVAGAHRVVTLELHAGQIQGFFNIPVDNLYVNSLFVNHIKENFADLSNAIIVSPDVGGVLRARSVAKWLNTDLAIVDKRRAAPGISEALHVIGDVSGKDCILVDDIADTAGTLCGGANILLEKGARSVHAYVTHGVFSANALENINNSKIVTFCCTDSIYKDFGADSDTSKIKYISCGKLFADSIHRIYNHESISDLFLQKQ